MIPDIAIQEKLYPLGGTAEIFNKVTERYLNSYGSRAIELYLKQAENFYCGSSVKHFYAYHLAEAQGQDREYAEKDFTDVVDFLQKIVMRVHDDHDSNLKKSCEKLVDHVSYVVKFLAAVGDKSAKAFFERLKQISASLQDSAPNFRRIINQHISEVNFCQPPLTC